MENNIKNNIKNNIRIPIEISKKNFHQKFLQMKEQAFQSRALAEVYEVWQEMIASPKNIIFLGLSGSLSSAGYWHIVCHLIKNRFIDVLVSTGANLSEDIYEAMGNKYYKVDPWFVDDKKLLKEKLDRFYDHVAYEYSNQVIVKRQIPILKEYERTKSKVNPRPFKFVKNLCEAHHIITKELRRYYAKWTGLRLVIH